MSHATADNAVVAMRYESYDREKIGEIIVRGMDLLGYRPRGRVFVKLNVVFAYNTKVFGDMGTLTPTDWFEGFSRKSLDGKGESMLRSTFISGDDQQV